MYIGNGGLGHVGPAAEFIMRTGAWARTDPRQVRSGITEQNLLKNVRSPVGRNVKLPQAEPAMAGAILGADDKGRPVRAFPARGNPTVAQAEGAMQAIKRAADVIRNHGINAAVPQLVGGPIASLARGEAIVLRWSNGVAIQAAL